MYPRTEMLDLIVIDGKGSRHRHAQSRDRRNQYPSCRCRDPRHRRIRQRVLSLHQRQRLERHGHLARAQTRRAVRQSLLTRRFIPTCIPVSGDYQSKLTLMSESLRNDGRIWVPKKKGDKASAQSDSRRRSRLLSGAPLSKLRQSGSARRRLPQREVRLRRRPRRRRERASASISIFRMPSSGWAGKPSKSATAICSICTSASRMKIRTRCRCASIPRSTTRWAACGSITT